MDSTNNRISLGQGYNYDTVANLTVAPGASYAHDAENRQISSNVGGVAATYAYDGDGRRVKKVSGGITTVYVYNAFGQMIAEYDSSAQAPAGTKSYITADHLGSTRVVTNTGGQVTSRHDYLPFGESLLAGIGGRNTGIGYGASDAVGPRQKFAGKERDAESGLDYFGARYHSSAQGRFTSPDPITVTPGRAGDPQQLNLYVYTRNNPLKYVDPTGMVIDTSQLSEDDLKKWRRVSELANLKDKQGNYVNLQLHSVYERLDQDKRVFSIVNANLGAGTAGQFTITKFSGPNDFSEARLTLNFDVIKNITSTTQGDFDSSFQKYSGLFGKEGFSLRLAETFGHEGSHGIFALDDLREGTKIQRILNDRNAALDALPKGRGRYPLPPDVMQKMLAAEKALIPTERYAQQIEKIINGELKAGQVKK